MKKLVALTCAGLMAASVVTGCASNNSKEERGFFRQTCFES